MDTFKTQNNNFQDFWRRSRKQRYNQFFQRKIRYFQRGSCGGSYSNRSGGSHVHQDCLYNPSHPRKVYRPTKPPKQLPASFLQWNPHFQWHIAMSWHTVEGYGRAPRSKGEVDNIMILESSQRLKTYLDFFFWPEGAPGIILPQ